MEILSSIVIVVFACILAVFLVMASYFFALYRKIYRTDSSQQQHAIRRNFPVISRVRYFMEQIAPEKELFALSASAGLTSPRQFRHKHVVYVNSSFQPVNLADLPKPDGKVKEVLYS